MSERLKNFLWLVLVLIIFGVITFFRGSSSMYLNFDGNTITVSAPENFVCSVPFENISDIEFIEEFDTGTMVNGSKNRKFAWGTWENETLGQYTLCASPKIESAIAVKEANGNILVFNYESNETTASLAEMIPALIESKLAP